MRLRTHAVAGLRALACTLTAARATRQITDAAGRVVTLPASVSRVADRWHANNAMVLMLGGADTMRSCSRAGLR